VTKNRKSRPDKRKGKSNPNHPPTKKPKADFEPIIKDETQEGNFTVMVGGVQPPKPKADFVPVVTDETVPGECIGIIGVSHPPKNPSH
jgi:hypothetical protein